MNDRVKRLVFRLGRIALIVLALMLSLVVMYPQRYLPAGMMLGEFFQGLLGAIFLALVFAAAGTRAWIDHQKRKREKK